MSGAANALLTIAAALALAGCGGGAAETDLEQFVGAWHATGGTSTRCGMNAPPTADIDETITITKGVDAPLVLVQANCTLKMDAAGATASLRGGQTCMLMRPLNPMATFMGGAFTVTGISASFS